LKIKAGLGFDIHRLAKGKKLILGGTEISFSKGLIGHSDGDCLIHALIDGLLGAMGERDIGQLFPNTDPKYRDIRSTKLLAEVMKKLKEKKFTILNIDSIILAEEPKLAPHISRMKDVLCPLLDIQKEDLGIKAKTYEGVGLVGEGEAMAAWVQVLVKEEE
jgi:2-C-methyl-D-erythritol 2,4-cyclodiphosphate synthase